MRRFVVTLIDDLCSCGGSEQWAASPPPNASNSVLNLHPSLIIDWHPGSPSSRQGATLAAGPILGEIIPESLRFSAAAASVELVTSVRCLIPVSPIEYSKAVSLPLALARASQVDFPVPVQAFFIPPKPENRKI